MNINNLIIEKSTTKKANDCWIDQLRFMIVQALDKTGTHIPAWFKLHRVSHIIDHFINTGYVKRGNVRYEFTGSAEGMRLRKFYIKNLSLEELMHIGNILPAPDIQNYIEFTVSSPHRSTRNTLLDEYDITCALK